MARLLVLCFALVAAGCGEDSKPATTPPPATKAPADGGKAAKRLTMD